MIISIITIMAGAVILATAAKYIVLQHDILIWPFYSYILWHILLFGLLLLIFYESRHGFRRTISIFTAIFYLFKRNRNKSALDYTISKYRDKSRKVYLSNAFIAVAITLSIGLALYSELVFFSVVVSDSMSPALKKGDLVLMQNIIVEPEVGDVILARVPDIQMPVMHRIASISGKEIRTKGDANPSADSWSVTKSQIRGKSVYFLGEPVVIRNLGYYFIVDASSGGKTYGPEFNAVSKLIRGIKAAGFMIFITCIILYLVCSIRAAWRTR